MADRFVQQDAGPARAEHDVHRAGGAGHRVEVQQRHAHGVVDQRLPHRGIEEACDFVATTGALVADLAVIAVGRDHLDVEAHQRPHVADELSVVGGDQHVLVLRDDARHHLLDARVAAARVDVHLAEQLDLASTGTSVGAVATG